MLARDEFAAFAAIEQHNGQQARESARYAQAPRQPSADVRLRFPRIRSVRGNSSGGDCFAG
ncbi:hypothetical protein [Streptomyces sp. NPDC059990]|uniref:hypothetical protein n=1 Tax=Streptomyces sp. NPDC059990 TaxID=3347027 RepID=UPI0036B35558